MSGGYVDSARETLEDMGYFDGMDDGNESEGGKTAAKCPHCGSADTVPCCPDINGEYCADGCRSCGKGF